MVGAAHGRAGASTTPVAGEVVEIFGAPALADQHTKLPIRIVRPEKNAHYTTGSVNLDVAYVNSGNDVGMDCESIPPGGGLDNPRGSPHSSRTPIPQRGGPWAPDTRTGVQARRANSMPW